MNKKYQPSNATEGYAFIDWQCHGCVKNTDPDDDGGCPIIFKSMAYSVDDKEYPVEWIYDSNNNPKCTAYNDGTKPRISVAVRDDKTMDMF